MAAFFFVFLCECVRTFCFCACQRQRRERGGSENNGKEKAQRNSETAPIKQSRQADNNRQFKINPAGLFYEGKRIVRHSEHVSQADRVKRVDQKRVRKLFLGNEALDEIT